MKPSSIKVTPQVRALLVELDATVQQFHTLTSTLSEHGVDHTEAVNLGANREHIRTRILGIAYRINKASRGENERRVQSR